MTPPAIDPETMIYKFEKYSQHPDQTCIICCTDPIEVFGKLTVCLPDSQLPYPDMFWAKDWSENAFWAPIVLRHIATPTTIVVRSGHVLVRAWKFKPEFIQQQFELTYNKRADIYEAKDTLFKLANYIDSLQEDPKP
jgi:hypothetical protein